MSPNEAEKVTGVYLEDKDTYVTGTQQVLRNIHKRADCNSEHCVVHSPSAHNMRSWLTHWRADLGMFERICPKHSVGVPDPDDPSAQGHVYGSCGCEHKKVQD